MYLEMNYKKKYLKYKLKYLQAKKIYGGSIPTRNDIIRTHQERLNNLEEYKNYLEQTYRNFHKVSEPFENYKKLIIQHQTNAILLYDILEKTALIKLDLDETKIELQQIYQQLQQQTNTDLEQIEQNIRNNDNNYNNLLIQQKHLEKEIDILLTQQKLIKDNMKVFEREIKRLLKNGQLINIKKAAAQQQQLQQQLQLQQQQEDEKNYPFDEEWEALSPQLETPPQSKSKKKMRKL